MSTWVVDFKGGQQGALDCKNCLKYGESQVEASVLLTLVLFLSLKKNRLTVKKSFFIRMYRFKAVDKF